MRSTSTVPILMTPTAIAGERVVLRPPTMDDANLLSAAATDAEIAAWCCEGEGAVERARDRVVASAHGWAGGTGGILIIDSHTVGPVGIVDVIEIDPDDSSVEISYWVLARGRGQGLASEAVDVMCRWLGDLGWERSVLLIPEGNAASCAVAARTGHQRVGWSAGMYEVAGRQRRLERFVRDLSPNRV